MFQKTKGKKSRFHVKISPWGPLTLRTEPKLGMLRGVISVKQQSFLPWGCLLDVVQEEKGCQSVPKEGWVGLARWIRNIGFLSTESHPALSQTRKIQLR